jgi:hypothetical protein
VRRARRDTRAFERFDALAATCLLQRYVEEVAMFEQVARNEEHEHRQSIIYLIGVAIALAVVFAAVLLR